MQLHIKYKEEYRQIFMLTLREIYLRMEKQIKDTFIKIKGILDGGINFSNENLSTE